MPKMSRLSCFAWLMIFPLIGSVFAEAASTSYNSSYTKVCSGSSSGLHHIHAGNPWQRYQTYVRVYGNCTTIQESLEIVFLDGPHNYDMSFLESIREVNGYVLIFGNYFGYLPLKNLRIIRGHKLFRRNGVDYSLLVAINYKNGTEDVGLKEVHLTSLREILRGEVRFESNNLLCYAQTVNWQDILGTRTRPNFVPLPPNSYRRQCNECDSTCNFNGTRYCWGSGPDKCQTITNLMCSSNCDYGCFGPHPTQCCDEQCAGGCVRNKNDCWACRNFVNDGVCVPQCPGEKIYDVNTFKFVDNPNKRYVYGTICVKECPDYMLIEGQQVCVSTCSPGHISNSYRRCTPCENGVCPKTCPGTPESGFVDRNNVANFAGCTVINGNLRFLKSTLDTRYAPTGLTNVSDLNVFETVEVITGYLMVQINHTDFRSLSFLRNLRIIYGRTLHPRMKAAILISGTSLEELELKSLSEVVYSHVYIARNNRLRSLGFVSLKKIRQGGVAITDNPSLCYVNTINWTQIIANQSQRFVMRSNADQSTVCEANGMVCSAQCSSDGCWGRNDDDCRFCADYRFGLKCVSSCEFMDGLYAENGTMECRKCHEECRDNCTGEGPENCLACRNVRDGPYCVSECPPMKYFSETTGSCEPCYENCKDGCTGSGDYVGVGACNSCHLVKDLGQGKSTCMKFGSECPESFYKTKAIFKTLTENGSKSVILEMCRPCHSECSSCHDSGTKSDTCTCKNFVYEGNCVSACPHATYPVGNECFNCHHECSSCYGPTASDCTVCKNVRVYAEESRDNFHNDSTALLGGEGIRHERQPGEVFQNETHAGGDLPKGKFNCTEMCPVRLSRRIKYMSAGNLPQYVCIGQRPSTNVSNTDDACSKILGFLKNLSGHTVRNDRRMPCNVEIKARIRENFLTFLERVQNVSQSDGTILQQEDIFFHSPNGRVKLRKIQGDDAQLIFYNRPDVEGPKLSDYVIAKVPDHKNLQKILSEAYGVKARVKKIRHLFLVGQTRIHVDQVEGLGNFMELEVVLFKDETPEHGQKIAETLMEKLDISKDDLLATAYADMLVDK